MYHDFSPSIVRSEGTSVIRTISASVRIATASSSPNSFGMRSAREDEGGEDRPHDHSRGHDDPPDGRDAVLDRLARHQAVDVLLPDAAHQEDHVVHRKPEEDREGDRGHERLDRPGPVEAREPEQSGPPAPRA